MRRMTLEPPLPLPYRLITCAISFLIGLAAAAAAARVLS